MKLIKLVHLVIFISFHHFVSAQKQDLNLTEGIVKIDDVMSNYYNERISSKEAKLELSKFTPTKLANTAEWFNQRIEFRENNKIEEKYFVRPDDSTLKYLSVFYAVPFLKSKSDFKKAIDSILNLTIPNNILIEKHYQNLFVQIMTWIRPFDFSKVNFDLNSLNFKNESEKAVFFLTTMSFCYSEINGFMNYSKPPNYKEAMQYISMYPKFNGEAYYKFKNLDIPDFISQDYKMYFFSNGTSSFKRCFINYYYSNLISHLRCIQNVKKDSTEAEFLFKNSILSDKDLFKYSNSQGMLEEIYNQYKK